MKREAILLELLDDSCKNCKKLERKPLERESQEETGLQELKTLISKEFPCWSISAYNHVRPGKDGNDGVKPGPKVSEPTCGEVALYLSSVGNCESVKQLYKNGLVWLMAKVLLGKRGNISR